MKNLNDTSKMIETGDPTQTLMIHTSIDRNKSFLKFNIRKLVFLVILAVMSVSLTSCFGYYRGGYGYDRGGYDRGGHDRGGHGGGGGHDRGGHRGGHDDHRNLNYIQPLN